MAIPTAVLEWLLEPDNPPVRYLTLTNLLHRSPGSAEVRKAKARLMDYSATQEILRHVAEFSGDDKDRAYSKYTEPKRLISTRTYEGGAQLSPDGRWLVYVSNESGQSEILARQYPALGRQWGVSEGLGNQPRWSAGGREIYYRNGAPCTYLRIAFSPIQSVFACFRLGC